MPVAKLTCPECKTVLKPAKPLPEGKAVKCPECGARFTAGAADAEAPAPKKKPAAGAAAGPPRKKAPKPAAPKRPAPAAKADGKKKKDDDDDDEGGGVYGVVGGVGEEAEDDDKPDINYAPDMSIKDLRGPAQAAVIRPSNMMIRVGVISFLGWIGLLVIILIPVLFPLPEDEDPNKPAKQVQKVDPGLGYADPNLKEEPPDDPPAAAEKPTFWSFFGLDFAQGAKSGVYLALLLSPLFLGMIYTAIMTYGAVRMQNLESYGWGMASSIMAMIPYYSLGFIICTVLLVQLLMLTIFSDRVIVWLIVQMVALILTGMAGGLWGLMVMLREEVVQGYAYKPE
jgi:hypothetical protein